MKCRFCKTKLRQEFIDLGCCPPSNAFLTYPELNTPELFYPLKLFVCHKCFLVQLDEYKASNEIFCENYLYFSSFSKSWLDHAKMFTDMITERLKLAPQSLVAEIASNDGYLLQYFQKKNIPCFGVEPSANVAKVAKDKGLTVFSAFFGLDVANKLVPETGKVDLLIANNVLAHVPDLVDFVKGIRELLKRDGVATLEFPHLMRLIAENQFDTIYHEHYSYFSFSTVVEIFKNLGLLVFDVEELPSHGGSLRIYVCHPASSMSKINPRVEALLIRERNAGGGTLNYYSGFQGKADRIKYDLLTFLIEQKCAGKRVVGYGAAAKGNTLINYAGIKTDLLPYVVDASPHKQGKFLPGSRIPVVSEDAIREVRPDYILILPWNIKDEIKSQLSYVYRWNAQFVVAIPSLAIEAR